GTLIITAMMTAGKVSKAEPALDWVHFGPMLAAIRDAAMARGKAELGAKTIIDGLDYLVRAVDGLDDPRAIATAAVAAVDEALTVFRPRPCTMGRARMFAERSIGLDDPGMLALAELTRAVVQAPAHGAHHNG
ncbi:MAG TPA: DAK2 domain-containing protein, partial [Devosia sp.]|nr:DAK2 domain-containing protein [Devosia sp.]